jgi:CHAD domain-containing protein
MTPDDRAEEVSASPVGAYRAETRAAELTPDMRSDQATRLVLSGFVARMLACEAGVIANLDPEWLHDYRVALRRSRSILREMKGVFPEREAERFAAGLKRIGEVTSPLRDWQVLLAAFSDYEAAVPEVLRPALAPLRVLLEHKAALSHRDLSQYLASPGYRRWMETWRRFLARNPAKRPVAPNAARPVGEVSDRRIWKAYQRFVRAAAALDAESPAESFHALRKKGKSLRYLLETFGPLHGEGTPRRLVAPLKKLQEVLGGLQDASVHRAHLLTLGRELYGEEAPLETLLVLGILVGELERRQQGHRRAFGDHYSAFARKGVRRRFRKWFAPVKVEGRAAVSSVAAGESLPAGDTHQ